MLDERCKHFHIIFFLQFALAISHGVLMPTVNTLHIHTHVATMCTLHSYYTWQIAIALREWHETQTYVVRDVLASPLALFWKWKKQFQKACPQTHLVAWTEKLWSLSKLGASSPSFSRAICDSPSPRGRFKSGLRLSKHSNRLRFPHKANEYA